MLMAMTQSEMTEQLSQHTTTKEQVIEQLKQIKKMKKQNNYVSEETLKALSNANIIDKEQPAPTITDCVVWFAEQGISIITDYNRLDHEWSALSCGRVPGTREPRRSQSYIDAMNAAIREAAEIYQQNN